MIKISDLIRETAAGYQNLIETARLDEWLEECRRRMKESVRIEAVNECSQNLT